MSQFKTDEGVAKDKGSSTLWAIREPIASSYRPLKFNKVQTRAHKKSPTPFSHPQPQYFCRSFTFRSF